MKKFNLHILLISVFTLLVSCEKYLDQQPRFALTESNAITSYDKAKAAVNGIYATFRNDNWSGALYVAQATKAGFVNFSGVADYNLSYTQETPGGSAVWSAFYRSLNSANFAITGIEALPESAFANTAQRNALLGEAKAVRAWINLNILWNFGYWWAEDESPYGLIYRDKPAALDNVNAPRITVGESYRLINEDLDFAIQHAADFDSPRYISRQFAQILKAKSILYRAGYRNETEPLRQALTLVNRVLEQTNAKFQLQSDLAQVYQRSWESSENLFVKYLEDDGSRTSAGGYWYTYGIIYQGNTLPLAPGGSLTAGLRYGTDWFAGDPRWSIATGEVRAPETWDNTFRYTFKKLARLGSYQGKVNSPVDEKYATYYFRFAELYLLKAELLARTGASVPQAIAPINELRQKRSAQAFKSLSPLNQEQLYDAIFKEIFLELCLENGSEFFASIRFKKDNQPWIVAIKDGLTFDITRSSWPIPNSEIINNPSAIQNPGQD
ncbi:RagB/SusD family nutrient uptake outer membrane protein [Sphingobacterium spiritivorum]|uniref:RagB/SusD family nutrient uptake outer membrane protein n=1 Tax=Sphingobacterium spiritivorum TaxID=258 RepID=UPI003DA263D1